jgi:hypothetical protein
MTVRVLVHARDIVLLTPLCRGAGGIMVSPGGAVGVNCTGCLRILAEREPKMTRTPA